MLCDAKLPFILSWNGNEIKSSDSASWNVASVLCIFHSAINVIVVQFTPQQTNICVVFHYQTWELTNFSPSAFPFTSVYQHCAVLFSVNTVWQQKRSWTIPQNTVVNWINAAHVTLPLVEYPASLLGFPGVNCAASTFVQRILSNLLLSTWVRHHINKYWKRCCSLTSTRPCNILTNMTHP